MKKGGFAALLSSRLGTEKRAVVGLCSTEGTFVTRWRDTDALIVALWRRSQALHRYSGLITNSGTS